MDLDRLSTGEKIAGACGVLLFIFMFFDWYSVDVSGSFVSGSLTSGNAWDWLDVIPVILLIAVLAAVGVAVIRLTDALIEPQVSVNAIVAVLGAISVLLILYRIVDTPGGGSYPGISVDVSPALGIFLSLLAAIGIAYGGYRAMQEEGASFGEIGDRLSGGGHGGPGAGAGPGASGPGAGAPGAGQPPASTTPPPPPPPPPPSPGGPPSP
jgi:hypothetical protein